MKIKHKITFEFIIDAKELANYLGLPIEDFDNDKEDLAEFIDNYLMNDDEYGEAYLTLANSNLDFDTETTIIH